MIEPRVESRRVARPEEGPGARPGAGRLSGRNLPPEDSVRSLLASVLAESPETYGYGTYEGRFGWTLPKLRDCLEHRFGVALGRATLRRYLHEMGCSWEHKRFSPQRHIRGRGPEAGSA